MILEFWDFHPSTTTVQKSKSNKNKNTKIWLWKYQRCFHFEFVNFCLFYFFTSKIELIETQSRISSSTTISLNYRNIYFWLWPWHLKQRVILARVWFVFVFWLNFKGAFSRLHYINLYIRINVYRVYRCDWNIQQSIHKQK